MTGIGVQAYSNKHMTERKQGSILKLYIIRHGQTMWNKERLLQGRSDIELNENGRELARRTGGGMKDIPFDIAYTSPLKRAKETAYLVLGGRRVPVIEDERIAEISFGKYEGTHWSPGEGQFDSPEVFQFFNHPEKYVPPADGESMEQLAERTADFLRDICSRPELADKTILVSSHGAAVRAMLNSLEPYEMKDFWKKGVAPNCGVAILECADGKLKLLEEGKLYY